MIVELSIGLAVYPVNIERVGRLFVAYCVRIPGYVDTGRDRDEALDHYQQALYPFIQQRMATMSPEERLEISDDDFENDSEAPAPKALTKREKRMQNQIMMIEQQKEAERVKRLDQLRKQLARDDKISESLQISRSFFSDGPKWPHDSDSTISYL